MTKHFSEQGEYTEVVARLLVRVYEIHKQVLAKGGGGLVGIRDAAMLHAAVVCRQLSPLPLAPGHAIILA